MIGKSSLVINDILGKRIYNTEIQINSDSPNIELKSFQLPRLKGIYTLTILHESGTFKTLKLFKNK